MCIFYINRAKYLLFKRTRVRIVWHCIKKYNISDVQEVKRGVSKLEFGK